MFLFVESVKYKHKSYIFLLAYGILCAYVVQSKNKKGAVTMAKILELMTDDEARLSEVCNALSSPVRIRILKLLYYNSYNVKDIAEKLSIPPSSAALNIRILENADLIQTKQRPGSRGAMKICSRKNDYVNIRLSGYDPDTKQVLTSAVPIGAYTDCSVAPSCGITDEKGIIGYEDHPCEFFRPERANAQLLWSASGYIEYKLPLPFYCSMMPKQLILSFEACSEAPNYKEDWKSDITIWLNGLECATWRSPGDLGSRRGKLNPVWWDNGSTQYGKLVTFELTDAGSFLNNKKASDVSIADLMLNQNSPIAIRIGNKADAEYVGGFNLFGKKFGDYEQDILLSFIY